MRLTKLLFFLLIILAAPKLCAASDYKEHCAACHGEHAEGGFGPSLNLTVNQDEFKKIIRQGQGMMPAIGTGDLSDEDIDGIYKELGRLAGGAAVERPLFTKKNVKIAAWGSVALMFFGAIFILFARYVKWSGFSGAKKYYSVLGFGACLKIAYKVFFSDTLFISSVYNKDKKRWLIHGLIAYGFIGLIIADILIAIFNPERLAMPFLSPIKIFVNLCGAAVLAGLSVVVWRFFTDPYENNGVTLFGDLIFVVLLLIVTVSGFATEATRYLKLSDYTQHIYFVHIACVIALIATAPFTRFVHILSTFFFVLNTRLAERVAETRLSSEFNEEPAPGRHFKSARVAQNLFGEDTKIRYFP